MPLKLPSPLGFSLKKHFAEEGGLVVVGDFGEVPAGVGEDEPGFFAHCDGAKFMGEAHGMGAQEGAFDGRGNRFPDATDDAEHLELVFRVKAVTALDFQGYRTFFHHFLHAYHGLLVQLVLRSSMQQVAGIEDTAALRKWVAEGGNR